MLGNAHPDIAAFEREVRSHIPQIPEPPAPASVAQDAQDKAAVPAGPKAPVGPKSFAGLSGTSPDGRRVSLDNIGTTTVVLYFWSANNKESIREADGMEGVYNQYRGRGVSLEGVVSGSSGQRLRVLREEEVRWPQILDNGAIASRFPGTNDAKYVLAPPVP